MLIRLEQSFIESAEKLNERFSEQDRVDLSQVMEANYAHQLRIYRPSMQEIFPLSNWQRGRTISLVR